MNPSSALGTPPSRVLIVDDERSIRRTLGEFLRAAGYEVAEAEDADAALAQLRAAAFDVVVSDIILPRVNGVELLRLIHSTAPDVQVVMMTGEPTVETAAEALRLGATDYLFKPIDKAAILRVTRTAARIKALEDARRRLEAENQAHRENLERLVAERTAQLQVSEAREAELRKLWHAVERSPATIVITDAAGAIEYVNPQFERDAGYTAAEVTGQNPRLLRSGVHPPEFYAAMWRALSVGQTWRGEICKRRKDGSLFWEFALITPVADAAGRTTHYIAIKQDITERRRIDEELRQAKENAEAANRAKSVFLANMSHEIRTPMNAVLGFTQLLLRDPSAKGEKRRHLENIMRSGEHLLSIINEILTMARIESGRTALNLASFDPAGLLGDLQAMFSRRAQTQGVACTVQPAAGLPHSLTSDPTKLRQILINLLGNAFKFTPAGGRIAVRLRVAPESLGRARLIAQVEDTGPGMTPEEVAQVFEPFFQADAGRAVGGTGLGLSISREFARLMGGDLTVTSQVGCGSCFELQVPVQLAVSAEHADDDARPEVSGLTPASAGYRVLVVDDDATGRELQTQLLTGLGFSVRTAANGLDAVQLCQTWTPGLVLLDLRMPVMDGFEAARRLRAAHGTAFKILVLSASVLDEVRQQTVLAGADAFIGKPFVTAELLERIRELTGVEFASAEREPELSDRAVPASAELPSASAIRQLPAELLKALQHAFSTADYDEMLSLVASVQTLDEPLARHLRELLEAFDFAALDEVLKRSVTDE